MTRYAVGLGSNLGDRLGHLVAACAEIGAGKWPWFASPVYETAPVGGPEQDPFLNAVVVVDSDLQPREMLGLLQQIEQRHGRERTVRWGPRTLDLDIVAMEGGPHVDEVLTVPHPRAHERGFVLRPLVDVWPEVDVGDGLSAADALATVGDDDVTLLARDWVPPIPRWPGHALVAGQFALILTTALAFAADGTLPAGEVTVIRVLGAVLAMTGVVFAFIASRRLGPAMTPSPVPKQGSELVMSGPYRYVRHPIYGGLSLLMIGTALFLDSAVGLGVAILLLPFFWFKSSYEERQLRMRFAGYKAYRDVVHRRLIPFVI